MGAGLTREERKRLKELQSLKAQQKKKKKVDTAQDTIPYKEMSDYLQTGFDFELN